MVRFLDGPAKGVTLSLARSPRFLRVVIDLAGQVDALDQPEDVVRAGETAYVYELFGDIGSVIYCSRGHGCRREQVAEYRQYAKQPSQELLGDNQAWQTWAMSQAHG
jgi:hypothetical protein